MTATYPCALGVFRGSFSCQLGARPRRLSNEPEPRSLLAPGRAKGRRGQVLFFITLFAARAVRNHGVGRRLRPVFITSPDELNNSTQAAALAGAYAMSLPGATHNQRHYRRHGVQRHNGQHERGLQSAQRFGYEPVTLSSSACATLTSVFGSPVLGPFELQCHPGGAAGKSAAVFLPMFGGTSATLTSTATAAMRGASVAPYNVAIIVDSTQSMTNTDSDSHCNSTRISCALAGVQILLQSLVALPPDRSQAAAPSAAATWQTRSIESAC